MCFAPVVPVNGFIKVDIEPLISPDASIRTAASSTMRSSFQAANPVVSTSTTTYSAS